MSAMSESGKTPFVFLAKLRDQFVSFGQKAADGFRTPVALNALFAGAYTFVGFIVALTPIIWLVSHFSRSTVPVPIAARGALALLWSALGGTTRVTTSAGDIPGSTEWQAALAIRPTFLSIVFLFVAAWVLKRVIKAHASSTINLGWVATAFGVGVAVTGGLGALFGGGAVDWNDQTIARVRTKAAKGDLSIHGSNIVGAIEERFKLDYGLSVQVCCMLNGKPAYTGDAANALTLSELNRRAEEKDRGVFQYPKQ